MSALDMTPGELAIWRAAYAAAWIQLYTFRNSLLPKEDLAGEAADIARCAVNELRDLALSGGDFAADAEQAIVESGNPEADAEIRAKRHVAAMRRKQDEEDDTD